MTEQEVYQRFIAAVAASGGQRPFAQQHSITPAYVNDIIHGRRRLSDNVLTLIGVERVVTVEYRLVEVLDEVTHRRH